MNGARRNSISGAAVLIPVLFLFAVIAAPILSQETFYRIGFADPQWIYHEYISKRCKTQQGGTWHYSDPPNMNFYNDSMYYALLDSAGLNVTVSALMIDDDFDTSRDWRTATWYHGIQLFVGWNQLIQYAWAQGRLYGVGGDFDDYFEEPYDPNAGVAAFDEEEQVYVFHSDIDDHTAGFLINDTLAVAQRLARTYNLDLRVKIRNPIQANSRVLWVRFGSIDPGDVDWSAFEIPYWFWDHQSHDLDDEHMSDTLWLSASELDTAQYTTVNFRHYYDAVHHYTKVEIFWLDSVDLYVDWMRIYDDYYRDLVLEPQQSVYDDIVEEAEWHNAECVNAMYVDEPHLYEFEACHILDSLIHDTTGKRLVSEQIVFNPSWYTAYIDQVQPDFLYTNQYTLTPNNLYVSDPPESLTVQDAWDYLIYAEVIGSHPEDHWIKGFRPIAEVADSTGVPWFPNIQASTWWNYHSDSSVWEQIKRDPTRNEIFCQAYLAFAFGAKGISYFTIAPVFAFDGNTPSAVTPNPYASGCAGASGVFDFCINNDEEVQIVTVDDFPNCIHQGFLVPNDRYYAIKDIDGDLDLIEEVLLQLDWEYSFATHQQRSYSYIDSVWTVGDDTLGGSIDSTFVQVGVFDCDPEYYPIDRFLMFVNRRCLVSETRTVHARFDFGSEQANLCLDVEDYLDPAHRIHCCTNDTGVVEDFSILLAPGHGKLLRIHNPIPVNANIDSGDTLTWASDTTVWVVDTLEVEGTLIIEEGATVKVCDVTDGIVVKPDGHISILGTEQNPVTIEGVADPVHGNLKLWGSGNDTIMYANIKNLNYGVAIGEERTLVLKHCNISHCNSGVVSVGNGTLYMDSCTVDSCNWEGIHLNEGDEGYIKNCTITHSGESGIRLNGVKSTFKAAYNSLEGNNANTDSIYEAIHLYYCSPEVFGNHIENNVQDGVGSYHDSYPVMNQDSETQGDALNRLVNNWEWIIDLEKLSLDFA